MKLREERGNPEVMREKMQKIFQELIEKIKSQLDDDQKKKLEGWQKKADESRKPEKPETPAEKKTEPVEFEPGKNHEFRYLLNNEKWYNEWEADEYILGDFGKDNCVIELPEA